ncbi:MAG: hypothetical protein ACRDMU_07550 [Gaiellaceae bacterium]
MRRRTFLLAAAASGLSLAWRSVGSWPFSQEQLSGSERLAALLDGESARAVGREYLRAFPAEASRSALTARVAERLPGGSRVLATASDDRLRELLLHATSADFGELETVELRGWVLARTEARLCALAALHRASPPA